jgi:hypothetical protein
MEQQPYIYTSLYDGSQLPAERQLKFLVPEVFYRRLRTEKLLRKRSFQDLLNEALEQALRAWDRDRADEEDSFRDMDSDRALNMGLIEAKSESLLLRKGEYQGVRVWLDFVRELPEQTVAAMKQAIEDYLRYFRSSRLKGPSGSGEGDGDGQTRSE